LYEQSGTVPTVSTSVVVPGAWDTPAVMDPLLAPLEATGHAAIVVGLPRGDPDATAEDYAAAVQAAFPDDPAGVMLAGYSFGGFTASTIAAQHHQLPLVLIAACGPSMPALYVWYLIPPGRHAVGAPTASWKEKW
jgi:pimeloyl-ACP methyl ester carboxylesterase